MLNNTVLRFIAVATMIIVATIVVVSSHGDESNQLLREGINYSATNRQNSRSFLQKTEEDPIATFTAFLAISTTALFIVTAFQLYFLNRSDQIGRLNADTAKQSLELTQRAFVHLEVKELRPLFTGGHIRVRSLIVNNGNTPATIIKSRGHTVLAEREPDEVSLSLIQQIRYSLSPRASSWIESFDDELVLTQADLDSINARTKRVFYFCAVEYLDVFGHSHQTGTGVFFEISTRSFAFIKGDRYNYAT